ncbi:MAG: acyl-CoA synthase [Alphaproteobacteria bacterium]|nr:MAG: acyl-CoA synthase [Alphaproteobacteria bacterium]
MPERLKTTRPVREVRTIQDVEAIEALPYDEVVPARALYDLLRATAECVGDQKAITVLRSEDPEDVGISLSHRELLNEVTRAANMFRKLGLAPDTGPAAFLAPTLPELPALLLGAQVAGVASAINYLLTSEAIVDLLNAEGARILIIPAKSKDEMCWTKADGIFDRVPSLRHVLVMGEVGNLDPATGFTKLEEALAGIEGETLSFDLIADRDTVCAMFHTGGTTGRPKLVQLTHGNQIHAAFGFAQVYGYNETDVVINGFPFFHVGGTMTVGLSVIAAGGHIVIPSPYALRPPAVIANYWKIVDHFRATVISGVPTSIGSMVHSFDEKYDISRVRMAATGGAVLPAAVGARFTETTGIRLFETYGMTESAAAIAFNPGFGEPVAGSVGFRAPYSETRIVAITDDEIRLCPPGESGLVQAKGLQVFPGYLDPAHNKGTLEKDGWLTTGDVGYLTEDERLVLTGREKDLIVRSGHNIDPAAIENVANRFQNVEISAAVGMPDQYAGEVPALFVVPKAGASLDMEALEHWLETELHEAPARPRIIEMIDALPTTAVGKIFKPTLRDLAIEKKVALEVAAACGPVAEAQTEIMRDAKGNILVTVRVVGAEAEGLETLRSALKPLPQTYMVEVGEG